MVCAWAKAAHARATQTPFLTAVTILQLLVPCRTDIFGLVGFLSRWFSSKPTLEDRVWKTEALKLEDIVQRAGPGTCLIVYHFAETGERLRSLLDARGLDYEYLERPSTNELERHSGVGLLDSGHIPEEIRRGQAKRSMPGDETPCDVHLAEHYPIPGRDDHVLNLHAILPPGSEFHGYVGLDEAWIEKMLGSSTRALLDQLGMKDSEPLSHSMIGGAIRSAQKQLDKKRRNIESYARSSAEWMQLNVSE